jgi:hypothetical protein
VARLAGAVVSNALVGLFGIAALGLDDLGARLEPGLDRQQFGVAVLVGIDPFELRRDPARSERQARALRDLGKIDRPAQNGVGDKPAPGRQNWNTMTPCCSCSSLRRYSTMAPRRLE